MKPSVVSMRVSSRSGFRPIATRLKVFTMTSSSSTSDVLLCSAPSTRTDPAPGGCEGSRLGPANWKTPLLPLIEEP